MRPTAVYVLRRLIGSDGGIDSDLIRRDDETRDLCTSEDDVGFCELLTHEAERAGRDDLRRDDVDPLQL